MTQLNAFQLVRPRGPDDSSAVPLNPHGQGRAVDQLTTGGKFIKSWPTMMAAARSISPNAPRAYLGGISNCVRGVTITAHGFKWRYKTQKRNES